MDDTKKSVTVFCDMDGCIAKWNPDASIEDTYEPDYFRNCKMDYHFAAMLNALKEQYGIEVIFLSAVYGNVQADAKRDWLNKYGFENILITCPYGECKREFLKKNLPEYISDVNILIDDFTKNLERWQKEPEFIGVKYLNGINNTHGTWTKTKVNAKKSYQNAAATIANVVRMLNCDPGYEVMFLRRHKGEITEKEFTEWYESHCGICPYMSEICMYGEA